jgi:hypothetical protein
MIKEYTIRGIKGYYCEFYDSDTQKWELTFMPSDKVLTCCSVLKDEFHILDESMIEFY